jgi:lipopolysaccharide export system protein LptC
MVLRLVGFALVMETMEAAAVQQDLLCTMMTSPLVMPFVRGILFGMHLVNSQKTQVVCHQEHPWFKGHTVVAIVLEAMVVVAEDLLCAMMTLPLVMPFVQGILFGMRLVNSKETQVVCHQEHPCFEGHTMVGIVLEAMVVVAEDLLCTMMTSPLVMPFVQGVLFGMRLVNSKETQVVCHQEHPCFEGHTMVGIVLEAMAVVAEDLLCAMTMTVSLVMPFFGGILFGMRLVNLQETQVVCLQEHPCFEGHTMVGIILEAMVAMPLDLFCATMMTLSLVMPFVWGALFGMRLVNSKETQVVCHQEHPCFEGHTVVAIVLEAMAVVGEDLLCSMMMMVPLVMPFVRGVLFGMHLVNLQETQVVCR